MNITRVDLKLKLDPIDNVIFGSAFLTLKQPAPIVNLMINKKLKCLEISAEVKGKKYDLQHSEKSVPEDCFLKSAKIWSIELPDELIDLKELLFTVRFAGQIESDPWGTNYITSSGVELGLYVAYYPILNINDRVSFSLILQAPKGWEWIMNSERLEDCKCDIWVSEDPKIDLYLIGVPKDNAIDQEESTRFWGNKRNYERFSKLDIYLQIFYEKLVELLGKPPLDCFKLVLVPREKGGMITRQGLIVMQDNIPEDFISDKKNILLLKWVHELGHFWFNKTSVETYHNWIDEALCDFCALYLSKSEFGEEFYINQVEEIEDKVKTCEGLMPLKDITRSHEKADILFYKYGSLIFKEIYEMLGEEDFNLFLVKFAKKSLKSKEITTEDLEDTLKKIIKKDWKLFLEEKLEKFPLS